MGTITTRWGTCMKVANLCKLLRNSHPSCAVDCGISNDVAFNTSEFESVLRADEMFQYNHRFLTFTSLLARVHSMVRGVPFCADAFSNSVTLQQVAHVHIPIWMSDSYQKAHTHLSMFT